MSSESSSCQTLHYIKFNSFYKNSILYNYNSSDRQNMCYVRIWNLYDSSCLKLIFISLFVVVA